jgi:predicted esterase
MLPAALALLALGSCAHQPLKKQDPGEYISRAMTAYSDGNCREAISIYEQAFPLIPENATVPYNIGCCFALLGEADSALAWLEKSFQLGIYTFSGDEDLASLGSNPRFLDLERRGEEKIKELQAREWNPIIRTPEHLLPNVRYPVVVALHGFGGNPGSFAQALAPAICSRGYILCCPYATGVRGAAAFEWGDAEVSERRVLEAVASVKKRYRIDPRRVILLGYSQGGWAAFYTGLRNPLTFRLLIVVAGFYDSEFDPLLDNPWLKDSRVYMMVGERDEFLKSDRTAEERLRSKGISHRLVVFPGLGHAFPPDKVRVLGEALKWVDRR